MEVKEKYTLVKKDLTDNQAINIFADMQVDDVLTQKILRVGAYRNLIKECDKRITDFTKREKEYTNGFFNMRDWCAEKVVNYTNVLVRLKKSYYNALESLQLQVEKEKMTKGYFK
tara:strand:- start:1558 stop:1902 length:345 start_codon:yes stop_codon:yes gene_type:complete